MLVERDIAGIIVQKFGELQLLQCALEGVTWLSDTSLKASRDLGKLMV